MIDSWDIGDKIVSYLPSVVGFGCNFWKGYAEAQGNHFPPGTLDTIVTYGATIGQAAWSRKQAKDDNESGDDIGMILLFPLLLPYILSGEKLPEPEKKKPKNLNHEMIKGGVIGAASSYLGYLAGSLYGRLG